MFQWVKRACAKYRITRPLRVPEEMGNQELGELGEKLAARWLVAQGRKVLYRNYRGPEKGEVDLVTRDRDVLAFVEVKTRREGGRGRPLDSVNKKKRELIRRGGLAWLKMLNEVPVWRHDVAEVILQDGEPAKISMVRDVETSTRTEIGEIKTS